LKEIKPLLNLASHGQQPCSHVKQLARRHLNEIEQKFMSCSCCGRNCVA
jgi:hypothetical protein